jgi:hypothetical protein
MLPFIIKLYLFFYRVFSLPAWPAAFREDVSTKLADGFARSFQALGASSYPDQADKPLETVKRMQETADTIRSIEPSAVHSLATVNVSFRDRTDPLSGVQMTACTNCGDCNMGCK